MPLSLVTIRATSNAGLDHTWNSDGVLRAVNMAVAADCTAIRAGIAWLQARVNSGNPPTFPVDQITNHIIAALALEGAGDNGNIGGSIWVPCEVQFFQGEVWSFNIDLIDATITALRGLCVMYAEYF